MTGDGLAVEGLKDDTGIDAHWAEDDSSLAPAEQPDPIEHHILLERALAIQETVLGKDLPHHSRSQDAKVKKIPKSKAKPGDGFTATVQTPLYAERGTLVVAKGAKRPRSELRGLLQAFQPITVSYAGAGELKTLVKAEWRGGVPLPPQVREWWLGRGPASGCRQWTCPRKWHRPRWRGTWP